MRGIGKGYRGVRRVMASQVEQDHTPHDRSVMQGATGHERHTRQEETETMGTNYPTNADDVIDSRDIIEAIEELGELSQDDVMPSTRHAYVMLEALLIDLREMAEDYNTDTPEDGMTLVRDSYFKDHAREMVEECGYFTTNADRDRFGSATTVDFNAWPYRCIDWRQVADELQQDYTAVLFDGVTYWVR